MTRDQIVALVGQRLGSRTDMDTEIVTNIQWVQETTLEGNKEFLPWFLLSRTFSVTLASGAFASTLASTFLRPSDTAPIRIYPDSDTKDITKLRKKMFDAGEAQGTDAARPTQCAFFATEIVYDRKADKAYTVYFPAYVRNAVLSAGSSNNWSTEASDWLIAEVLKKMALRLGNSTLYTAASAEAAAASARVWAASEAYEHAAADYVMSPGEERPE